MSDEIELYPAERVAIVVERLATLLQGGGAPAAAWARLAAFAESKPVRARRRSRRRADAPIELQLADAVAGGANPADVLQQHDEEAWRALGALWSFTEQTGAPLGASLQQLAAGFRDLGQSEREVAIALAGPAATARLVTVLPFVGMALGFTLGFDTFGVLVGGPVGWVLLSAGALLLVAARQWNRALIDRATQRSLTPGLGLDLIATGMHGGADAGTVAKDAAHVLGEFQLASSGVERAGPVLKLAAEAGVPAGDLLRSEAQLERQSARTAAAQAAARLGTQLMLPLGVCILPAFLALGVAPILIAVLRQAMP